MATISMMLPSSAWMSTSDVTSWASAQMQMRQSSATVPSPRWIEWLFDASTDEHLVTAFIVPNNYFDTPVLEVYYKCTSATSGTLSMTCQVHAISDSDSTDLDADAYAAANNATQTVPGTAGHINILSISLTTDDSMAPGDFVTLMIFRDVSGDSVSADVEFIGARFLYNDS